MILFANLLQNQRHIIEKNKSWKPSLVSIPGKSILVFVLAMLGHHSQKKKKAKRMQSYELNFQQEQFTLARRN